MHREVPSVRPSLAAFALIAVSLVLFGNTGLAGARRSIRKLPKIEIHLTGPATLTSNESLAALPFQALLTNRSSEPQAFIVRGGYLMNANWYWTVTDDAGSPIGMEFIEHGYCGTKPYSEKSRETASWLHDTDLFVLAPGESREFSIPGGPSDDYYFPSAGTYHLSVSLIYVPPNTTEFFDENGKPRRAFGLETWKLGDLGIRSLETLQSSLPVQARSDIWNLWLPSSRRPQGKSLGPISAPVRPIR